MQWVTISFIIIVVNAHDADGNDMRSLYANPKNNANKNAAHLFK